jgi:uncharacterized sulfatase
MMCHPEQERCRLAVVLAVVVTSITAALADAEPAFATNPLLPERPNVVFIAIEDFSPQRLGCYGGPVHSPNIDRLAGEGVLFEKAYAMVPVCNASRTALLTGLRPDTTRVFGNGQDWREMLSGVTTMPMHFRRQGYDTIRLGKMYHGLWEHDASWTLIIKELHDQGAARPKRPRIKPKAPATGGGSPLEWGPTGNEPEDDRDGQMAEQAARFLRQRHERPFFLGIGFHSPHLTFRAPDRFHAMYDPKKIELPNNPKDDLADTPIKSKSRDQLRLTTEEHREITAAHYATISYVDWCVGKVLDAIRQSGREEDTIVVLWSDHGFMLGEHFLWRKGSLYEHSARVAFIWKVPGLTAKGARCSRPVETIDTFPTLFDLCNLPQPEGVEGISMRRLLENPGRGWKKGAITFRAGQGAQVAIQTERYRLNKQLDNGFLELYDHRADPGEFTNRASDPRYKEVVDELTSLLDGGWRACLPDGEL